MKASVGISIHEDEILGILIDADLASAGVLDSVSRPRRANAVDGMEELLHLLRFRAQQAGVDIESIGLTPPQPSSGSRRPAAVADEISVVAVDAVDAVKATSTFVRTFGLEPEVRHYILLTSDAAGLVAYLIDRSVSLVLGTRRISDRTVNSLGTAVRELYEAEDVASAVCIVSSNSTAETRSLVEKLAQDLSAELIALDDAVHHHHSVGAALYAAGRRSRAVSTAAATATLPRFGAVWLAVAILAGTIGVILALLGSAQQGQNPGTAPPREQTYKVCGAARSDGSLGVRHSDPVEPADVSHSPSPPPPPC